MLKAFRDFLIYDFILAILYFFGFLAFCLYSFYPDLAWGWMFLIQIPTITVCPIVIGIYLGRRTKRKYFLSYSKGFLLSILIFIVNFLTLLIYALDTLQTYSIIEFFNYYYIFSVPPAAGLAICFFLSLLFTKPVAKDKVIQNKKDS